MLFLKLTPAVSTNSKVEPAHETESEIKSRVTPSRFIVKDLVPEESLLNSVDFPTLVLPTKATFFIFLPSPRELFHQIVLINYLQLSTYLYLKHQTPDPLLMKNALQGELLEQLSHQKHRNLISYFHLLLSVQLPF